MLLDATNGAVLCAWADSFHISANLSPSGLLFVDTRRRGNSHLRDITNCNEITYIDNLSMYHIHDTLFSLDGNRIAFTAHPRRSIFDRYRWVYIYDFNERKILNEIRHKSSNSRGLWDDKFHYFRDGETVLLWTEIKQSLRAEDGSRKTYHRRVILQNVLSEEIFRTWWFQKYRYQLALHPDEMHIAIFDRDAMSIYVEELYTGNLISKWHVTDEARAMEYHPDGEFLVTLTRNGLLNVFDTESLILKRQFNVISNVHRNGLTFAPDGKSLAVGSTDGWIAVYPFSVGRMSSGLKPEFTN